MMFAGAAIPKQRRVPCVAAENWGLLQSFRFSPEPGPVRLAGAKSFPC